MEKTTIKPAGIYRSIVDLTGERFGMWLVLGDPAHCDGKRGVYWKCRCDCGTEQKVITHSLRSGNSRNCGCIRKEKIRIQGLKEHPKGVNSPHWKGGRFKGPEGYINVYAPDHLRAGTDRYIYEHTLVMENVLGRPLYPHETVHHKNGVRSDNRPENLELWSKSHPPGQRIIDKVDWAKRLLLNYLTIEQLRGWLDDQG